MILITHHAAKVAEWIDEVCAEPSRYTVSTAWKADFLKPDPSSPTEIELHLTDTDQMLFDLRWAGCFIKHPNRDRWYDATSVNAAIIALMRLARSTP